MTDNGILASIPGQYVSAALEKLPEAGRSSPQTLESDLDVPGIGLVRFTAVLHSHKHGKSRMYFWSAVRAVRVSPNGDIVVL